MHKCNSNEWYFLSCSEKKSTYCSFTLPSLNRGRTLNLHVTFFCQKSVTLHIFSSFWKSISNVAFLRPFLLNALASAYFWFLLGPMGELLGCSCFIQFPVHKLFLDVPKSLSITSLFIYYLFVSFLSFVHMSMFPIMYVIPNSHPETWKLKTSHLYSLLWLFDHLSERTVGSVLFCDMHLVDTQWWTPCSEEL